MPHRINPVAVSVDGFARVSRDKSPVNKLTKPAPAAVHHPVHAPASHVAHHKPQRATTLMRTAVKKPNVTLKPVIKTQIRTDVVAPKPANAVTPKLSYTSINPTRHARATQMAQSTSVSHFGKASFASTMSQTVTPSVHVNVASPAHSLDFIQTTTTHAIRPTQAKPALTAATRPVTRSSDIFEQALANATPNSDAFEDLRRPRATKRKRAFGIVGVSFAVLLAVGFLGYTNASQLSLKVASYRSGIHAKLPTYNPGNYAFNHLDYKPGTVTANYNSTSSNQAYSISQRASDWDSQALLSNVVATAASGYKTYERAGRTVYVMSNNTATWVDSGILYTVEGNAALSSTQLLELASSM